MLTMEEMIARNKGNILDRWTEGARQSASARGLSAPEMLNIMPVYLSTLGDPTQDGARAARLVELAENHFASRVRHGFDLGEIIQEFTLLERCIQLTWTATTSDERPALADMDAVFIALHDASARMADMFVKYVVEDAQADKRHYRFLRQSFDAEQPHRGNARRTLDESLHDAITVVMDAMGAATSAIFLYDQKAQELVMTASAGLAIEGFSRYARALTQRSLVGLIASRLETTMLADAETTELDVTDTLRHSGIHAVLGVRLPMHDRLLGVMYVGVSERRTFSPRERRRMEALAENLALLIENAQLQQELEAQIDKLNVEKQLRDVLVSLVAHDLRGPLAAASLAAKMLTREGAAPLPPADLRARAARISRSLDRIEHMVQDLLDAHRIHAGEQLAVSREPCDLAEVARDVVAELTEQHGARFELTVAAEPVTGRWDAGKLRRSIWNLASNAVKYGAAASPVHITIRCLPERVEIAIHNEGNPIPPDSQAKLFEPFVRGPSEPSRSRGWGLGLTLVRDVAEAHGGSVDLESAPDRGTTFTLRLPYDGPGDEAAA